MSSPILQVRGLRVGYGKAEVLHGIDLQADKGSVITVIGPNGAGKSTLLSALMGILRCQGSVNFEGQSIAAVPLEERVMMGLALVPEKRELFATMPVEDNLLLGGIRQMRMGHSHWRDRMADVYELFPRLKERKDQLAGTLSGGERQMLAIGRALMGQPSVLMLDEPSLGLAPLVVREIFKIISELRQTGVTIVLVEQNARAALAVADYAYVLEMGEISLHGAAAEMAEDERIISSYLGASRKSDRPVPEHPH